jgi:hypothetical protein
MTDTPRWERYFREIDRFAREPEALERLFRELGDPDRVIARKAELDAMLESRRWWRKLGSTVREVAVWIASVGGAIVLLFALWRFLSRVIT